MIKMSIVKNISFLKVSAKTDCTIEFSVFFLRIVAPVKIDFGHFFENDIFDMKIVKNCIK